MAAKEPLTSSPSCIPATELRRLLGLKAHYPLLCFIHQLMEEVLSDTFPLLLPQADMQKVRQLQSTPRRLGWFGVDCFLCDHPRFRCCQHTLGVVSRSCQWVLPWQMIMRGKSLPPPPLVPILRSPWLGSKPALWVGLSPCP